MATNGDSIELPPRVVAAESPSRPLPEVMTYEVASIHFEKIDHRGWPCLTIRSFEELMRTALLLYQCGYFYRGQADAEWGLVPSLHRIATDLGWGAEQAVEAEKKAVAEFRAQAHLSISQSLLPNNRDSIIAWWSLMQHHHAPTRLLDWTASPLVAAYFAVEQQAARAGAIWVVHRGIPATIDGVEKTLDVGQLGEQDVFKTVKDRRLGFFRRNIQSDRMAAQQGEFCISPYILCDHGTAITAAPRTNELGGILYCRLLIPPESKASILSHLRMMNITARSLFPGSDGLGKSVNELLRTQ